MSAQVFDVTFSAFGTLAVAAQDSEEALKEANRMLGMFGKMTAGAMVLNGWNVKEATCESD